MSASADAESSLKEQTLISHLEALRSTLFHCLGALAIAFPVGCLVAPHLIRLFIAWVCPPEIEDLKYFGFEPFFFHLKLALIVAVALAHPYNVRKIWQFVLPALYESERRAAGWWIVFSSVLFALGVVFCIGVMLPFVMRFALSFGGNQVQFMPGYGYFLNLAMWMSLGFGVMFQFPVVVLLLVRFGVVRTKTLTYARPYVVILILILAAILTPPDVVSQIILAVPTWLLFELSLLIAKRIEKPETSAHRADATPPDSATRAPLDEDPDTNDYRLDLYEDNDDSTAR